MFSLLPLPLKQFDPQRAGRVHAEAGLPAAAAGEQGALRGAEAAAGPAGRPAPGPRGAQEAAPPRPAETHRGAEGAAPAPGGGRRCFLSLSAVTVPKARSPVPFIVGLYFWA